MSILVIIQLVKRIQNDMSIANLWKRKDAKLRTLDADSVMVAGCQKSRNSKELSILFAILKSKRLTILFFS